MFGRVFEVALFAEQALRELSEEEDAFSGWEIYTPPCGPQKRCVIQHAVSADPRPIPRAAPTRSFYTEAPPVQLTSSSSPCLAAPGRSLWRLWPGHGLLDARQATCEGARPCVVPREAASAQRRLWSWPSRRDCDWDAGALIPCENRHVRESSQGISLEVQSASVCALGLLASRGFLARATGM